MIIETLPDIPRAYTGLAEWAACLVYILILRKRLPIVPLVLFLAAGAAGLFGIQVFAGTLPIVFWTMGMVLAVAGMFALLCGSAQVSAADAGYFTARALVLAELVASLQWQLESYFLPPTAEIDLQWHVLAILSVYGAAFTAAYFLEARHFPKDRPLNATSKELISTVAIALATFTMGNMSFVNANTPFSGRQGLEIFRSEERRVGKECPV